MRRASIVAAIGPTMRFFVASWVVVVLSCDAATATFPDAGSKDAASSADACFVFCKASGVVEIEIGCGTLLDASTFGACAPVGDASPIVCPEDASAPYACTATATTTGTCGVSLAF